MDLTLLELALIPLTNTRRRETLGGREYVVVDAVILKVQVLNGSDGPLFYPLGEINQDIGTWNGFPLTAKHPQVTLPDGTVVSVSARIPKVAHEYQIGAVYNDRMVGEERLVEAWFDVENSNRIDKRIIPAVLSGKAINVSTGIFTGKIVENAKHNGVSYTHRVKGIRPDHLAVLMDEKGACSTSDGCGINIRNEDTGILEVIDADRFDDNDEMLEIEESVTNCGGKGSGVPGPCPLGGGKHTGPGGATAKGHSEAVASGWAYHPKSNTYTHSAISGHHTLHAVRRIMSGRSKHQPTPKKIENVLNPLTQVDNAMFPKKCPECGGAVNADSGKCSCGYQTKKMTSNQVAIVEYLVTNCECWKGDKGNILNAMSEPVLVAVKADAEKSVANASSLSFTVNALKEIKEVVKAPADAKVSDVIALVKTNAEKGTTTPATPPVPPTSGVITNEQIISAIKAMPEKDVLVLFPTLNRTVETAKGVVDDKRYAIMNQLTAHIKDQKEREQKLLKLKDKDLPTLNEYLEFQIANATATPAPPADANEAFLRQFFASTSPPATNTGTNTPAGTIAVGAGGGATTPITANTKDPLPSSVDFDFINSD